MNKLAMNFEPCHVCFNARVAPPTEYDEEGYPIEEPGDFTDRNDFSDISISSTDHKHRLSICSGAGKPVHLELMTWSDKHQRNICIGIYYPKFCPECGRPLAEYDPIWEKYGLSNMPYEVRYWFKAKGLLELEPKYFSSLMAIFEAWQPDDAFYDKAVKAACLNYTAGAYRVLICADGIGIQRGNAYLIASFKHSELDECLQFLEGIFSVLKGSSVTSKGLDPAVSKVQPTNFFF